MWKILSKLLGKKSQEFNPSKTEDIDDRFIELTSFFNAIAQTTDTIKNNFVKEKDGILYLPVLYVKVLREIIIDMYSKSNDPIKDGYMSMGNLHYTMEDVRYRHSNFEDKKDKIIMKSAFILYDIISKHPFTDGNKRTGIITCNSFLEYNGYTIAHTPFKEAYQLIIDVAEGKKGEEDCERFIRKNISDLVITDDLKKSLKSIREKIEKSKE